VIVWLLRHGIAADPLPGQGDAERALTADGIAKLERAGLAWKRAVGRVDAVWASPLLRAQQTAQLFVHAIATAAQIETVPELLPSARPLVVLDRVQQAMLAGKQAVVCVGHEPHLGQLLGLLLTGSERIGVPFKKGMLVGVELESSASLLGRLVVALSQRVAAQL